MPTRTDPMQYYIEIEDTKSKKTNKAQVAAWWSGDASVKGWHKMCDCQLAGFFNAKATMRREDNGPPKESWSNEFTIRQDEYLKRAKCDGTPSKKFRAVRAHLPTGDVIDIAA